MVVIRADANSKIGMGHVMRCLSVADALLKRGEEVLFVTADDTPVPLLTKKGIPYRVLHTDYADMEAELPKLWNALSELPQGPGVPEAALPQRNTFILVDSYYVTEKYLAALKKRITTIYMDDIYAFSYPVDMLINYNIYGEEMGYEKDAAFADTKLLLGANYVPLREEFLAGEQQRTAANCGILITTGGSDSFNLAGQLLMEAMKYDALKEKEYHVVSGSLNLHIGELQALAQKHENIHIHCNVTNMAELMAESEIALSAGGSTLYELCAMGVPVIAFSFAENQERLVQTFVKRGIAQYGGNYRTDGNKMIQNTIAGLETLLEDENLRTEYRKKARALVDGKGADRIAEAIISGR
ncbi:MAG: UDP-2,4-diacetamido-2,4,6-trideoxy-beta-L-altropyranose hydrolase [Lachnospiraceae bacterium]|nr:UDP-2,4-diacetamido-2,4,6-trideoxy-beta-L-altropyranose hydrolase [Lachnospiraceae bacterium]